MTKSRNVRLFFCGLLLTIGVAFTRGENWAVDTFTELLTLQWTCSPTGRKYLKGYSYLLLPLTNDLWNQSTESESNILTGCKGGKVSAQLLLWMVEDIEKAGCSLPTLVCRTAPCCINHDIAEERDL